MVITSKNQALLVYTDKMIERNIQTLYVFLIIITVIIIIYIQIHIPIWEYILTFTHYVYTCVYMYAYTCTCIFIHVYTPHMYKCKYVCIYVNVSYICLSNPNDFHLKQTLFLFHFTVQEIGPSRN